MGSMFRSETMSMLQVYLQADATYACVSELGELGIVQFKDLNPDVNLFQRRFVHEIRRCDEMERQLHFFEKEIKSENIEINNPGTNPEAPAPRDMVDLEATFENLEGEVREISTNSEAMKRNYIELTELKHVLKQTTEFFSETEGVLDDASTALSALTDADPERARPSLQLGYVAGVLQTARLQAFQRLLWFACRGNIFIRHAIIDEDIENFSTGELERKSVFTIFFQGEALQTKVKKICDAFKATLYPIPETQAERREMALGVLARLEDLNTVLEKSREQRRRVLSSVADNLHTWLIKVGKIKAIYYTMNMFRVEQKSFIAEGWCAADQLDLVKRALQKATDSVGVNAPTIVNTIETDDLPTYNRTNKFTFAFQKVIDAYGIATYKEVSPTPYTIITFPFLFGVMFGDAGHGVLMLLAALVMVLKEKSILKAGLKGEIPRIFFGGRYFILLMGIFSIYCGLIYNDVFSKSVNIFKTHWTVVYDDKTIHASRERMLDPANRTVFDNPYPFGLDPMWQVSVNKINFLNSLKKKLSVILGVVHMMFGIIINIFNHIQRKDKLSIYTQYIPQIIFMMAIFGYLDILIIAKWCGAAVHVRGDNCARSLLIQLINMFLFRYPKSPCNLTEIYPGQAKFQTFLVIVIVVCIPWMLVIRPLILRRDIKRRKAAMQPIEVAAVASNMKQSLVAGAQPDAVDQANAALSDMTTIQLEMNVIDKSGPSNGETVKPAAQPAPPAEQSTSEGGGGHGGHGAEDDFGEIFVLQAIHTIEYCLGCISNTASYLRLWALSLAHAQLSEVLWLMVLQIGLAVNGYGGVVGVFIAFIPWAALTVAILLLMEGLSAFLHALRLHWVEFQNKFYEGMGWPFEPFTFEPIVNPPPTPD